MPHKGPHISIAPNFVVNRILRLNLDDFAKWPSSVQSLATTLAEELFLLAYNPFIDVDTVKNSVMSRFDREKKSLSHHYANSIAEGISLFFSAYENEQNFRKELVQKLQGKLPANAIVTQPSALVACSTDATDLRMELPLMVVEPETAEQVATLIMMANEMKFAIIPRGGASGMTGGAIPMRQRSVIMRTTRFSKISPVDIKNMTMRIDAGVLTQHAIDVAKDVGLLLTIDPASKTASTIGGNIAENAGGPCAFEYGTTIDNLLSWRMVTPTGKLIQIERVDHPRQKIMPNETAIFCVKDMDGNVLDTIELPGTEVRSPGLGKDVTNKALRGLPGMQKEGVDGIIVDATFVLHKKPKHSKVLVLECYGKTMQDAAKLINEVTSLRETIRAKQEDVHITALEEFNVKYVQAIEYKAKSPGFGLPISVIIVQFDSDEQELLEKYATVIAGLVEKYENIQVHIAKDAKEAELFWEDRHKLSAIARRTSGFKINEDIVIPMEALVEFSIFLEELNQQYAAIAVRNTLQSVGRLPDMPFEDKELNKEFGFVSKIAQGIMATDPISDDEIIERGIDYCRSLQEREPKLAESVEQLIEKMQANRIIIASHMHAGDGNCHVNIPVNSNDHEMLALAEAAAETVMEKAVALGGVVSGEHGIGITKIAFLNDERMEAIRKLKEEVDPLDVMNPAKLTQRELPVKPFTFSFNRLINDIKESGLPDKERLIDLLTSVQMCTRCGKCKIVCPMMCPEQALHFHPRNKNIIMGALVEAIYYTQISTGRPAPHTLAALRELVEHCTACGRCTSMCPLKIPSAEVALALRNFVENEGAGNHPIKGATLKWISKDVSRRAPLIAKAVSFGQRFQNRILKVTPKHIRQRFESPLFAGQGPRLTYRNAYHFLHLDKGHIFVPKNDDGQSAKQKAVVYFPGCGGTLFSRNISLASLALLLKAGLTVIMPPKHLCCGTPLLASGDLQTFEANKERNKIQLAKLQEIITEKKYEPLGIITACGSCRDALGRYDLKNSAGEAMSFMDITQCVLPLLPKQDEPLYQGPVIAHISCHREWSGVHAVKGAPKQWAALDEYCGSKSELCNGCCAESGMGAITSPRIYNALRLHKQHTLADNLVKTPADTPILVSCPSCRTGISRNLLSMEAERPVAHVSEWLASLVLQKSWGDKWYKTFHRRIASSKASEGGVRIVDMT